jgi:ketosteroid isomerase-like protein
MSSEASNGDSLAVRLDRLESRNEIEKLVANFCHGVDKHDEETFLSIWDEEGVWARPQGDFRGKVELLRALREIVWVGWQSTQHWANNLVIEIDGDAATGTFDMSMQAVSNDGISTFASATYSDRYARRGNRWGIVHRSFKPKYFAPAPGIAFEPSRQ